MNETTVTVTGATDARRRRRLDDAPATTVLFEMLSRRPSADLAADLDAALATGVLAHRLRARSAAFATVVPLTVVVAFPDPTPGPTPGPSTPTPTARPQSVAPTAAPTVGCDADDPPPRVVEVVFDDSGATVDVAWDAETDLGGGGVGIAFACGSILDFPGATDATCYWSDERTVRADVASAAIVPGDNATALGGVLRRACVVGAPAPRACACHPYANASRTVVLPPENPPAPAIVLEAPETVSRCEGGFVSALQSGGSGGRDFTMVAWSIAEPGAAWAAVPSTATKWYELVLNASHLNVSSLDVRLELANFLGGARAARTRSGGAGGRSERDARVRRGNHARLRRHGRGRRARQGPGRHAAHAHVRRRARADGPGGRRRRGGRARRRDVVRRPADERTSGLVRLGRRGCGHRRQAPPRVELAGRAQVRGGRRRARAGRVRPGRDRRRRRVRLRDERFGAAARRAVGAGGARGRGRPDRAPRRRRGGRGERELRPRRQVGAAGGDVELRVRRRRVRRDGRRRNGRDRRARPGRRRVRGDARRGGDGRPRGDGRGHVRGAGGGLSARERRAALDRRRRRRERAARRRRVPGRG